MSGLHLVGEDEAFRPPSGPIVVIGGSAGAVEALRVLVRELPPSLPAPLLVVVHGAGHRSLLPQLLGTVGALPASIAEDGERPAPGHIYVAAPGRHLVLHGDVMRLTFTAEENRARPAIDPLFRSAAEHYGPDAVGVILSGNLDDGSAGLLAIRRAGGAALVQDPRDALYPDMPASAVQYALPDAVVPTMELAGAIVKAVSQDAQEGVPMVDQPPANHAGHVHEGHEEVSALTCPQCAGALWVRDLNGMLQYRCRTGHRFSQDTMVVEQARMVEDALWAAVRALEEQAALLQRLADRFDERGDEATSARYLRDAALARRRADTLSTTLLDADAPAAPF